MKKVVLLVPSCVNVVDLNRIKSEVIVPINETVKSEKDKSDWEIPSFMNKEKQNESQRNRQGH